MKKTVKFLYKESDTVFGNYDIMFPQTEHTRTCKVEFDGNAEIRDYFNQFTKFLVKTGFTKEEVFEQILRYCNYQDEISP